MGSFSIWHWLIVGGVALLLFGGKGKISDIMGDVAKGIKSFKKGMAEDDKEETVRKRLSVYHEQTKPLIGYYRNKAEQGALVYSTIAGVGDVQEITAKVLAALS